MRVTPPTGKRRDGALRARDTDRDVAVDLVEAAWVDGQLTREEYDERAAAVLRATTLEDLDREVLDLQPEGTTWRPGGPVRGAADAVTVAPTLARGARGQSVRTVAVVAAVLVALVVGFVLLKPDSDTPERSRLSMSADGTLPVTGWGFVTFREALRSVSDSEYVFAARLSADGAAVVFPIAESENGAMSAEWDGENWSEPIEAAGGEERLNLNLISPSAVDAALADVAKEVEAAAGDAALLFEVSHPDEGRVCFWVERASVAKAYGFECNGNRLLTRSLEE